MISTTTEPCVQRTESFSTVEVQLGLHFRRDLLDQDRFAVAHVKSQPERNSMGSMVALIMEPSGRIVTISVTQVESTASSLILVNWRGQEMPKA